MAHENIESELSQFLSKMNKLARLAKTVDTKSLFDFLTNMNPETVGKLMKAASHQKKRRPPMVDGDFYSVSEKLTPEEREIQLRVRSFMHEHVEPIADECWIKAEFPYHLIPKFAELDVAGLTFKGYTCPGGGSVLEGII